MTGAAMDLVDTAHGAEPGVWTGAAQAWVDHYGMVGVIVAFVLYMFYKQTQSDQERQKAEREIYQKDSETKHEIVKMISVMHADMTTVKNEISAIQNSIDGILRAIDKRSEAIIGQTNVLQMLVDKIGTGGGSEPPRPTRNTTRIYKDQDHEE